MQYEVIVRTGEREKERRRGGLAMKVHLPVMEIDEWNGKEEENRIGEKMKRMDKGKVGFTVSNLNMKCFMAGANSNCKLS